LPGVGRLLLLNAGPLEQLPPQLGLSGLGAPLVRPHEVTHEVDLVIETGAALPVEWLRHVHALGARIVSFFARPAYTDHVEQPIFGREGGAAFAASPRDAIWTLPQHLHASGPMLRTLGRVPVQAVPFLWSPRFVEPQVAALPPEGPGFGFAPQETSGRGWRLGIFEPNTSVSRNCFLPMLACDAAYRRQPRSVELMVVVNSFRMKEHPTFNCLAAQLELTKAGRATYEPALPLVDAVARFRLDAVVAHQWECGLHHTFCDLLHGGYPLVHNSEFLQAAGVGLFYPGFEAVRAGEVLEAAWAAPPEAWQDYRRTAAAWLARLSPGHPDNHDSYARLVGALMEGRDG
jgi:hypothetical protein